MAAGTLERVAGPEAGVEEVVEPGRLTIIVGLQSGDEGKGKIAGFLAKFYKTIASGQGGPNAGHTLEAEGVGEIHTHLLTAAVAFAGKLCILGNGKLVDPVKFRAEKAELQEKGIDASPSRVAMNGLAHFIKPGDVFKDKSRERNRKKAQGSTASGIPFSASDKALRTGKRVEEVLKDDPENLYRIAFESMRGAVKGRRWRDRVLKPVTPWKIRKEARVWSEAAQELKPYIVDARRLINEKMAEGENILVEGAQGFWLDPDHGKWPDVTSTGTTTAAILQGLGQPPQAVERVIGIAKLLKTQVGGRKFMTEVDDSDELAAKLRGDPSKPGFESGTTTGRPRSPGFFDLVELTNAIEVNGVTEIAITKMDWAQLFGETMKVAVAYRNLETGEEITSNIPSSIESLAHYEPVYKTLPTWGEISHIRNYDELPQEAKDFVELVQETLGVQVTILGVGAKEEEIILKPAKELVAAQN